MLDRIFKIIFVTIGFSLIPITISAQSSSVSDSINNRIETLVKTSNSYQEYKVIKKGKISTLKNEIKTEVSALEEEITHLKAEIKNKDTHIDKIQSNLNESSAQLDYAQAQKDKLAFLGLPTNKTTYNLIVFGIIIILLIGVITFFYKFKQSNQITVLARKDLEENRTEFDAFRKKALETQQKLGRQIINERNKQKVL